MAKPYFLLIFLSVTSFRVCTALHVVSKQATIGKDLDDRCSVNPHQEGLDLPSTNADVVLTGTIIKLRPELYQRVFEPRAYRSSKTLLHEKETGKTITADIKVWTVMKGSIEDIENIQIKRRNRKRSVENTVNHQSKTAIVGPIDATVNLHDKEKPVIELHGLWNTNFCGSFLKEGDTRVFFLKKMEDKREVKTRQRRSLKVDKNKRKKRKRKNRKGKNRNHSNKQAKKRSNKKHKKSKQKKQNSYPSSPSMGTMWANKRKHSNVTMNTQLEAHARSKASYKKSVLLINFEPARITLQNLQKVEALVKKK